MRLTEAIAQMCNRSILLALVLLSLGPVTAVAQITEPEPLPFESPRTPMDDDARSGIGLKIVLNNFGVGVGGEYKRVLSPMKEGYATLMFTGLRDVSEQTFTDFFFGQQIVPNKYKRGFSMPVTFGLRQRMFAERVSDNYRFYLSAGAGPVLAFTYPYFNDRNGNGYREDLLEFGVPYSEPVYDIFTGMGDGDWHLGLSGEVRLSLDIGQSFTRLTSIQFGYMFYYFNPGLQMMEPNRPVTRQNVQPGEFPFEYREVGDGTVELIMQDYYPPQRFFGTPMISFVFGKMW